MAQVRDFQARKVPEDERSNWIEELIVRNFKSLAGEEPFRIAVRPLTLLAGANSSGKSSAVQPLLLLKQTLESPFDPGALLLSGPHLEFTSTQQMLPQAISEDEHLRLEIGAKLDSRPEIASVFLAQGDQSFEVEATRWGSGVTISKGITSEELTSLLAPELQESLQRLEASIRPSQHRCFLELTLGDDRYGDWTFLDLIRVEKHYWYMARGPRNPLEDQLTRIIHVRGLRDRPQRTYPRSALGGRFPGPFEPYVASMLQSWQEDNPERLKKLGRQLESLGLTWKVQVRQPNASELEVAVGRLPHARRGGAKDLVNIADVGFGVSQTLPVLVALLAAEPGQLVFLEQPEIHLHPKAQVALAEILADAARRKVRVIAETHSILLLTAVQALVAEGRLPTEDVLLHWFERNSKGVTEITTRELDEEGRYGDWPEDFADTEMAVQSRYLEAVERRLRAAGGGT